MKKLLIFEKKTYLFFIVRVLHLRIYDMIQIQVMTLIFPLGRWIFDPSIYTTSRPYHCSSSL
jgi:hypothetical protein